MSNFSTLHDRVDIVSEAVFTDLQGDLRAHLDDIDASLLPDNVANRLMQGAYQHLQRYLFRPLVEQTRLYMWAAVPSHGARIKQTPVLSVDSVKYVDQDYTETEIAADQYETFGLGDYVNIGEPAVLYPKGDSGWVIANGTTFGRQPYPFRVLATVGWQLSDMPPPLQQAALMIATDWFTQKMSGVATPMYRVKNDVRSIVNQYSHNHGQVL